MSAPRERVMSLVAAARRLADSADELGKRARRRLPESTGLSPEGVDFALARCLETNPSAGEVDALCASVVPCDRAHVVTSANVFVAAHRAIAVALAAARRVEVRPSTRESQFAELLREAGGAFEIVREIAPRRGDHVWAYGTAETLAGLRGSLPAGVCVHAHGPGFGVAVVERGATGSREAASALALDVVAFDQRGCLSPRVLFAVGDAAFARELGSELAEALERAERDIPLGELTGAELADVVRYRDTAAFAGEVHAAGRGFVGVTEHRVIVAPAGRNVHVARLESSLALVETLRPLVRDATAVGLSASGALRRHVRRCAPRARLAELGDMQRPPFDGVVDRR